MKIQQKIIVNHELTVLDGDSDPTSYLLVCGGCGGSHVFQARSKGMADGYTWKCSACGLKVPLREAIKALEK